MEPFSFFPEALPNVRIRMAMLALVALFAASAIGAQAALTTGSLLNGTIADNYSSNHAYVGQGVILTNVTSDDGSGSVVGGKLYGIVDSVQAAGQGRPGKISFHFTHLVLANGREYTVDGRVTKMQAQTKNNTAKEVGGALAGMLVGNAIGKTLFHASGGGVVGAVGGFMLAKNNRQNVNVSAGTVVQVQLDSVTRRQSH
jgi:hypothetical protein